MWKPTIMHTAYKLVAIKFVWAYDLPVIVTQIAGSGLYRFLDCMWCCLL